MILREATLSDIPQIYSLSQTITYNSEAKSESGFLVAGYTAEKYSELLGKSIFYVAVENERIVGYRIAVEVGNLSHKQIYTSFHRVTWENVDLRDVDRLIYLAQSGVHPDFRRRGIASLSLYHLYEKYPDYSFFCAIAEKPVRNSASIAFFESKGYQRIGFFRPEKYKDIQEYMSGRYALIR